MKHMAKNYICTLIRKLRPWTTGSMSKDQELKNKPLRPYDCTQQGWMVYGIKNVLIKVSPYVVNRLVIEDHFLKDRLWIYDEGLEHNVSSENAKNFCFDKEILDQLPEKCFSGFDTDEHFLHEAMYATEEDLK